MNPVTPTQITHLKAAAVRLIERHGDICSGTLGRIVGRYARENPTYLVSFDGTDGVTEVRGDEIAASSAA
jgi:hypothetical protein